MKKTLLASAVLASLATATAQAGTFALTTDATGATTLTRPVVASEIFGTGSDATALGNFFVAYTLAANPEADFTVTFTLTGGATWGTALTSLSLDVDNNVSADAGDADVSVALTSGGAAADTTAVFRVNNASGASGLENGDRMILTFNLDTLSSLATNGNDMDIAVSLNDNLGSVDTTGTTEVVEGQAAFSTQVTDDSQDGTTTVPNIDVATSNKNFTAVTNVSDTTHVVLGTVDIDLRDHDSATAGDQISVQDDLSTALTLANLSDAGDFDLTGFTVTVTGDFSASTGVNQDADATIEGGVFINLDNGAINDWDDGEQADTLTTTTATFNLTDAEAVTVAGIATNGAEIIMEVDGSTDIPVQSASASATMNFGTATYADITFSGNMKSLSKNGASVSHNYALTPNGAFGQFFRVVNTSTVNGDVSFTLTTDAGVTSNSVLLASVSGQTTSTLNGGNSTGLVSLNDMYAAVQAAQSTFDAGTGKLRVTFSGEFPSMDMDTIALSKDGNSFTLMNN